LRSFFCSFGLFLRYFFPLRIQIFTFPPPSDVSPWKAPVSFFWAARLNASASGRFWKQSFFLSVELDLGFWQFCVFIHRPWGSMKNLLPVLRILVPCQLFGSPVETARANFFLLGVFPPPCTFKGLYPPCPLLGSRRFDVSFPPVCSRLRCNTTRPRLALFEFFSTPYPLFSVCPFLFIMGVFTSHSFSDDP